MLPAEDQEPEAGSYSSAVATMSLLASPPETSTLLEGSRAVACWMRGTSWCR
ncbi:hypothetical protein [Archangium lansingense]|uniref:Uncharacterized protein n=1 Tax=Archangium lansingense TaxID=2995310 RepID=A0ABT3ZYC4_9BACT|nr:hypothetical protein [Archangium lansinium]MCY1074076.1 hypothetical protein [Archangium lansinium]